MAVSKRVTIADIAKLAGVSTGAVSFALNGRPGVSDETRAQILRVAREQKWQPNSAARALVAAKADAVGLALARPARMLGAEAFFTHLIAGIESRLSEHKVGLQLRLVKDLDEELSVYRHWFGSNRVDGEILIDPRVDDERQAYLRDVGAHAVVIGSRPSPDDALPTVWIDDSEVAQTLFDYVSALGHTRVVHISGPLELDHIRLRAEALEQLRDRDVATETVATDFSPTQAAAATRRVLSRRERPTAIVFDNDTMAVAGLRVTQEMGLSVPRDVSLASFDDSATAELVHPSLTAMTRDTFELGDRAAQLLLEQIESDVPVVSVPGPVPTLSVRESTAPPLLRQH